MNCDKRILSKRFISLILTMIIFMVLVYTTDHDILNIATSISIITGIYITAESIRKSQ